MLGNFGWLVPGRLAGSAQPGGHHYDLSGDQSGLLADLDELAAQGLGALVTLTEQPLREDLVRSRGMDYLHLPLADMQAPSLEEIARFVAYVQQAQIRQQAVAVHCRAGLGRTGTMLASYLVSQGYRAREAVAAIRQERPGSVETPEQEEAVQRYADSLAPDRPGGNGRHPSFERRTTG